ncbi:hypothetical protein [Microtetraspora sp. NBRC 13810]|uniref:CTP synthase C-terminal region-related (seleno)protein n=1 Tax=Microtetraspora sp. NBRC 13810 TaxID=3030990 RepID=UPI0025538E7B|nr:hypothetical protein [Microtetraspora sp. NBRC 13810]
MNAAPPIPKIALVGDRSPGVRAHARIPSLLEALRRREGLVLDAYWIRTDQVGDLGGFDGVWLAPGSPYRSEAGALAAARTARERAVPFLGTCGGFQHALLGYAREVCGLEVGHGESGAGGNLLITPLACSLAGHEGLVRLAPGSAIEQIMGVESSVERYHCSYGLNPAYLPELVAGGLRFTGFDEAGEVRVAELPAHPFFLATLFQPELAGDGDRPHPVISAFAAAVAAHAGTPAAG